MIHFGRAVGRHASILATVSGGEFLEDEQAEEFGHPLLDLQCEQLLGELVVNLVIFDFNFFFLSNILLYGIIWIDNNEIS